MSLKYTTPSLQRAVAELDPTDLGNATSSAQLYKDGHRGLLAVNKDVPVDVLTTYRDSYRPPIHKGMERGEYS